MIMYLYGLWLSNANRSNPRRMTLTNQNCSANSGTTDFFSRESYIDSLVFHFKSFNMGEEEIQPRNSLIKSTHEYCTYTFTKARCQKSYKLVKSR